MRKLFVILSVFALISCSKDKEDPKPSNLLIGTWTGVSQESDITSGGKDYVQALTTAFGDAGWAASVNDIELNVNNLQSTIYAPEMEIKNDGTWSALAGSSKVPGKWEQNTDGSIATFTLDNIDFRTMVATIKKLTDTDLWLEVNVSKSDPYGLPTMLKYTSVMKFSRKK